MTKKLIRYILSFILYYSGFIEFLRWIQKRQHKLKILVYHRVDDNLECSSPVLPVLRFRRHMNYLKRYYNLINLSDAIYYLENNKEFPCNAIIVTFDDGYRDIFENVLPIIKELEIPITIFLTSGCLGNGRMLWTDTLYLYFKEQNRLNVFFQFKEKLKNVNNKDRIMAIDGLKPKTKIDLMLDWSEVEALSQDMHVEIGAHSRTHPILTQMKLEEAREEILESKNDIEQRIGRKIRGFSYPAGKFDGGIKRIVKESGFSYACSVDGRFNSKGADTHSLSRINIDNCAVFVFAAELCGVFSWLRRVIN